MKKYFIYTILTTLFFIQRTVQYGFQNRVSDPLDVEFSRADRQNNIGPSILALNDGNYVRAYVKEQINTSYVIVLQYISSDQSLQKSVILFVNSLAGGEIIKYDLSRTHYENSVFVAFSYFDTTNNQVLYYTFVNFNELTNVSTTLDPTNYYDLTPTVDLNPGSGNPVNVILNNPLRPIYPTCYYNNHDQKIYLSFTYFITGDEMKIATFYISSTNILNYNQIFGNSLTFLTVSQFTDIKINSIDNLITENDGQGSYYYLAISIYYRRAGTTQNTYSFYRRTYMYQGNIQTNDISSINLVSHDQIDQPDEDNPTYLNTFDYVQLQQFNYTDSSTPSGQKTYISVLYKDNLWSNINEQVFIKTAAIGNFVTSGDIDTFILPVENAYQQGDDNENQYNPTFITVHGIAYVAFLQTVSQLNYLYKDTTDLNTPQYDGYRSEPNIYYFGLKINLLDNTLISNSQQLITNAHEAEPIGISISHSYYQNSNGVAHLSLVRRKINNIEVEAFESSFYIEKENPNCVYYNYDDDQCYTCNQSAAGFDKNVYCTGYTDADKVVTSTSSSSDETDWNSIIIIIVIIVLIFFILIGFCYCFTKAKNQAKEEVKKRDEEEAEDAPKVTRVVVPPPPPTATVYYEDERPRSIINTSGPRNVSLDRISPPPAQPHQKSYISPPKTRFVEKSRPDVYRSRVEDYSRPPPPDHRLHQSQIQYGSSRPVPIQSTNNYSPNRAAGLPLYNDSPIRSVPPHVPYRSAAPDLYNVAPISSQTFGNNYNKSAAIPYGQPGVGQTHPYLQSQY